VYRLRAEPFASIGMTLCARAGLCGRLTPLVTDLPRSEEPMDVVILTTGSPGDNLLYIQHSSSHLILSVWHVQGLLSVPLLLIVKACSVLLLGFNSNQVINFCLVWADLKPCLE
jgi:hypothetical protein